MTDYIDRLSEFGETFQNKIIYSLIHDIEFLQSIQDTIEIQYFESDDHQWILQKILEYYDKYRTTITMEVFAIAVKSIKSDSFKQTVKDTLQKIYTSKKLDDLDFVKDQFETFCKNQKLKDAIIRSTDLLKKGKYDDIKRVVDEAMKAGMKSEIGQNWIEDVNIRLQNLRSPTSTHMAAIDNITDGGLGPGEIGVIAAPSGVGKCVGGDAVIDIEYEEIGFEIKDDVVIWFKPWDIIHINQDIKITAYEAEQLLLNADGFGKTS